MDEVAHYRGDEEDAYMRDMLGLELLSLSAFSIGLPVPIRAGLYFMSCFLRSNKEHEWPQHSGGVNDG